MKELHLCSMKPAHLVPPHSNCQEECSDFAVQEMDFLDAPLIHLSTYSLGKSYRSSTQHSLRGLRTTVEFLYKADTSDCAHAV